MPTGSHKNFMLKCSWIEESANSTSPSAYAENLSSPNCLLYRDKTEEVGGIDTKIDHFCFEAWWVLEEACEEEIRKLWESKLGSYPNHFLTLAKGLKKRVNTIKARRGRDVKSLTRRLEALNGAERTEESLAEIVDVKLHLNMVMDKEEQY
ncbi:hypothetical protein PVK06_005928 [Gossypium arboreum]|uniref:Uncharacterized protein n=1 Tax=Gossypium arboreum TaxID=29729 RepID=A0ABR0QWV7_GOSAR|nr:hypothetical protein PVK06_005928 [Gossypium arboreum]